MTTNRNKFHTEITNALDPFLIPPLISYVLEYVPLWDFYVTSAYNDVSKAEDERLLQQAIKDPRYANSCFHTAVVYGFIQTIHYRFLQSKETINSPYSTLGIDNVIPIMQAAQCGEVGALLFLLQECDVDVNADYKNYDYDPPSVLGRASLFKQEKAVELLLEHKANPKGLVDHLGKLPSFFSPIESSVTCIELLMKAGDTISNPNPIVKTAARYGDTKAIVSLFKKGIKLDFSKENIFIDLMNSMSAARGDEPPLTKKQVFAVNLLITHAKENLTQNQFAEKMDSAYQQATDIDDFNLPFADLYYPHTSSVFSKPELIWTRISRMGLRILGHG